MAFPRLLLLSNSKRHGGEFFEDARDIIGNFFMKSNVQNILFIPYALKDCDDYASKMKEHFIPIGIQVESIHEKPDAVQAVNEAKGIFIGGGNTFLLLKTLYEKKIINPIRSKVLQDGMPYMGSSAGTNVATTSICTTNDMPIVHPPSLEALNLVPFNINPHYIDADVNSKHMGETRERRIKEYHEVSDTPVLGLREGSILKVEGQSAVLLGTAGAKLFQKDKETVCYEPGDDLSFLLKK